MAGRYWASVDVPPGREEALPYKAFEGLPDGPREALPTPDVLVIDQRPEGFFLIGHTSNGEFTGDTWQQNLDKAQEQADFAYGPYLGTWNAIPDDIEDAVRYALEQREAG